MATTITATRQVVADYQRLFVNRRAFTMQSMRPHPETGRHYYFRPNKKGSDTPLMLTDETIRQVVLPVFYSLAGEEVTIPRRFHAAVRAITKAVNCVGCSHCHFSRAPKGKIRIGLSSVGEVGEKGVETTCKEG